MEPYTLLVELVYFYKLHREQQRVWDFSACIVLTPKCIPILKGVIQWGVNLKTSKRYYFKPRPIYSDKSTSYMVDYEFWMPITEEQCDALNNMHARTTVIKNKAPSRCRCKNQNFKWFKFVGNKYYGQCCGCNRWKLLR